MKGYKETFIFAFIVCVICSVMLSSFYEGLRPRIEMNADVEVKRNILKAVGLKQPLADNLKNEEYLRIYKEKIEEAVIDAEGTLISGKTPADIKEGMKGLFPLYTYREDGQVISYAYPVSGVGLWSMLYGYLAIEPDAVTVRGITFYKQLETPGLGAEIEKDWFLNNFKGKKVWSVKEQRVWPVALVKGKVKDLYPDERADHYVDGITAATLTGKGVTALLDNGIRAYEPFFSKIRNK